MLFRYFLNFDSLEGTSGSAQFALPLTAPGARAPHALRFPPSSRASGHRTCGGARRAGSNAASFVGSGLAAADRLRVHSRGLPDPRGAFATLFLSVVHGRLLGHGARATGAGPSTASPRPVRVG